jgi:hypothetical protein
MSPELERSTFAMEEVATRKFGSTSVAHPFQLSSHAPWHSPFYLASWKSTPTPQVACKNQIELQISATQNQPDAIHGVVVTATNYPECGWGAYVNYSAIETDNLGQFSINYCFAEEYRNSNSYPEFKLRLPIRVCEKAVREGQLSYGFEVTMGPNGYSSSASANQLVGDYLASPESFLKTVTAELDALEAKINSDMESGAAWVQITDYTHVRSDNPPRGMRPKASDFLPQSVKTKALELLLTEIERQRTLVNENHVALYESACEAFPFYETIRAQSEKKSP